VAQEMREMTNFLAEKCTQTMLKKRRSSLARIIMEKVLKTPLLAAVQPKLKLKRLSTKLKSLRVTEPHKK
jgi:hypothetical protein